MTEENKKLSARARKNIQRNADAVRREIERTKRHIELLQSSNALKFLPENYQFSPGYQTTFKYQLLPEVMEVSRKIDELKSQSEIAKLQAIVDDCQDRLDAYLEQLAERS